MLACSYKCRRGQNNYFRPNVGGAENNYFSGAEVELCPTFSDVFMSKCSTRARIRTSCVGKVKLRASPEFKTKWLTFLLESIGVSACPIFSICDWTCFWKFDQKLLLSNWRRQIEVVDVQLSYEERNALQYTAEYVTRRLKALHIHSRKKWFAVEYVTRALIKKLKVLHIHSRKKWFAVCWTWMKPMNWTPHMWVWRLDSDIDNKQRWFNPH